MSNIWLNFKLLIPILLFISLTRSIVLWIMHFPYSWFLVYTIKPVLTTTLLKQPPVLNDHVVVLLRSNFALYSNHLYNATNDHLNDVPCFYYLHMTTTAQSAYPRSHNKFSRLSQHSFLFRTKMHANLFLSVSCVIKWKIMLPLYIDQISLLTVLAVYTSLLYNDHLSIRITETSSSKWSSYTGLTLLHHFRLVFQTKWTWPEF